MKIFRALIVIFGLLLLWQSFVVFAKIPPFILPTPLQVFKTISTQITLLLFHAKFTVIETLIGLIIGSLFGMSLAISMSLCRTLRLWLLPIIIISQAIPLFAIAPLLVIWLGYGMASKIAAITLMLFFPVASAFFDGLRRTPQGWLELAHTMNTSESRILLHLRIPAALPSLASGLKIATIMAPLGAILGEWVGASHGLGFLMLQANARLDIALTFSALFILIVFSLTLYASVNFLLHRYFLRFNSCEK